MQWFFTVVLIGVSVATLAYTGYLFRSVLTAEPVTTTPPAPPEADS